MTTEHHTPVFETWACDSRLTAAELRLLIVLMCHDLPDSRNGGCRKGWVCLRASTLSQKLRVSVRQIRRLIASLSRKGFVEREGKSGGLTKLHIRIPEETPDKNVTRDNIVTPDINVTGGCQKCPGGVTKKVTPSTKNRIEEEKVRKSTAKTTPKTAKPRKRKKQDPPKDAETLKAKLAEIDLDPFIKEYAPMGVDVRKVWSDFTYTVLEGSSKSEERNPYNYVNFKGAFRNWCKLALEKLEESRARNPPEEDKPRLKVVTWEDFKK